MRRLPIFQHLRGRVADYGMDTAGLGATSLGLACGNGRVAQTKRYL
jgi:hypothetical protein